MYKDPRSSYEMIRRSIDAGDSEYAISRPGAGAGGRSGGSSGDKKVPRASTILTKKTAVGDTRLHVKNQTGFLAGMKIVLGE